MPEYHFKAVNAAGHRHTGVQEAHNVTDLEMRLSRTGLDLINCKERRQGCWPGKWPGWPTNRKNSISRRELIHFSFHLEQLTQAGVPLIDALKDLRDSEQRNSFQAVIAQIIEGIEGGQTFSAMLERFPRLFGEVYASMVRVGEHSGKMDQVLHDLAENTKWQDELTSRLKRITLYPAIVAALLVVVILFVMVYLVPNMVSFIASTDYQLPWYTTALLATSGFFIDNGYLLLPVVVLLPLLLRYSLRHSAGLRYRWHGIQLKLKLWLLGPLLLRFKLARFAHYAAMMYAAGIPVLDIVQLSRQLVDNHVLDSAFDDVHTRIQQGSTIGDSFAASGLFPPLVVRMVRIGEGSGALDQAFTQIAYFYGREARESIQRFEQFIGPLLILGVGTLLLWVIVAVIFPLIDTAVNIGTSL